YVADPGNNRVRKITPDGIISTFAGSGFSGYSGDGGLATNAMLSDPDSVTVDNQGNVFIADVGNQVIRKVDATGVISSFARPSPFGFVSTVAIGLAADKNGNLYSTDGLQLSTRLILRAIQAYSLEYRLIWARLLMAFRLPKPRWISPQASP